MQLYPFKNAVSMSHMLLAPYAAQANVMVDMTCGNGYDTVFLATHMADHARLYAFDIQACAVDATKQRIADAGIQKNIVYRKGSHETLLEQLTEVPDIIMFNLGYLPSGDHSIYTKSEITIKAIKIGLNKLAKNGIIMLAAYPGTDAGAEEAKAVFAFLKDVPQKSFDVSTWKPINQIHNPPLLYMVQKRG